MRRADWLKNSESEEASRKIPKIRMESLNLPGTRDVDKIVHLYLTNDGPEKHLATLNVNEIYLWCRSRGLSPYEPMTNPDDMNAFIAWAKDKEASHDEYNSYSSFASRARGFDKI